MLCFLCWDFSRRSRRPRPHLPLCRDLGELADKPVIADIHNSGGLTPRVVDIILGSKTAQTLSDGQFYGVDAFTSANMLRLARGCPKLVDLVWFLDGLTPLTDGNGQNVDDLTELLESRAKQSSEKTYFEIDVFEEFGPWKADSYHYSNT